MLVVITGPRGVGKTTLAATYNLPANVDKVFYHDSENSANNIVDQLAKRDLAFGRYVSLNERFTDLPGEQDLLDRINAGNLPWADKHQKRSMAEYYEYVIGDLADNLEDGRYDVYVHDTLEKLEAGMAAWVELNKKRAGVSTTAYGRLWTDGVYPLYEQMVSAIHARGVATVILTSHLKTPWEDNRPVVGKVAPAGKKLLYRLAGLMLWLVNDPRNGDGAPAGLVLKERLGELEPDSKGQWRVRRMLPQRIPRCTWADIATYLQNGCDLANPAPGEVRSKAEEEMISNLLSDEQMRLMILAAETDLEQMKQQTQPMLTEGFDIEQVVEGNAMQRAAQTKEKAIALLGDGMDARDIAKELDRPLPLVKRWLEGVEGQ
jgi:hypothetical protein